MASAKGTAGQVTLQARSVSVPRRSFPLSEVYRLLEPGPVVLLTTAGKGRANVMTQSWHTMIEFEPPIVACVVSNRNFTFNTLKATKECVINIPTVELVEKVVACGNSSGRKVDKFETIGLTPVAASRVRAPLIAECCANLECRVVDTRAVNRYGLFILEVLKAWIDPARKHPRTIHHMGRGVFMVSGKTVKLRSKMK
jgi:flavin reductase (DIM6/NTAB) family NADH-FMN oxidoreductase RutF